MTHSNPYETPLVSETVTSTRSNTVRTPTQRYSSYVISVILILAASFGLLFNWGSFYASLNGTFDRLPSGMITPYFYISFYTMSAICVACYLAIILASIGLCRGSTVCARIIAFLLLFEVVYFLTCALLWLMPAIGSGVGAATGIANGGLMVQFMLLMPIWIPISLWLLGLYREVGSTVRASDNKTIDRADWQGLFD